MCNATHPFPSAGVHPVVIKPPSPSLVTLTNPLSQNSPLTLCSLDSPCYFPSLSVIAPPSDSPGRFFIYLRYLALSHSLFSFVFYSIMVATRSKNKSAHPAAPVMTRAAKKKAGIPTKPRPKKTTNKETIRELQARLAALEDPDREPFSKEPLVRVSITITCRC